MIGKDTRRSSYMFEYSLVAGLTASGADAYLLTGVSLALGVFNLLPIGPLDGGRILRAVASRWAGPDAGDRVCGLLTKVLAAGLAALGVWVLGKSGNFTLLLCAGWLLWRREGSR